MYLGSSTQRNALDTFPSAIRHIAYQATCDSAAEGIPSPAGLASEVRIIAALRQVKGRREEVVTKPMSVPPEKRDIFEGWTE
jgi:hypothetical protein